MDKKSRLEGELRLTEVGRDLLENIALSKHTNPSSIKVDDKKIDIIPIPEGATIGDIIKAMFPNCEQKEPMYNGYFEKYFDDDLENASYMRVSKDFWNAPYKKEVK